METDHYSVLQVIGNITAIILILARMVQSRKHTEEIKVSQQNAAASAVIAVQTEETLTRDTVKNMIDEATTKFVADRMQVAEVIDRLMKNDEKIIVYLKRVCAAQGIEWKDDVTVVPDHRSKNDK